MLDVEYHFYTVSTVLNNILKKPEPKPQLINGSHLNIFCMVLLCIEGRVIGRGTSETQIQN